MKLQHKPNTLWLEFGVASSFEGLPKKWRDGFEKGEFNRNGNLPHVSLIKV